MVRVTSAANTAARTTKVLRPLAAVADDHNASPEDRTFSRWLNEVEKNNARLAVLHSDQLQPLPTQVRFACSLTGSDGHAQTDRL
jgi:hypothetical protein